MRSTYPRVGSALLIATLVTFGHAATGWSQDEPTTQPTEPSPEESERGPVAEDETPSEEDDEPSEDTVEEEAEPEPEKEPVEAAPEEVPVAPEETEASSEEEDELSAEEMRALEEAMAADQAELDESRGTDEAPDAAPAATTGTGSTATTLSYDLAFIFDVAGAWFSVDEPLQTGAHDPNQTGFNFQQLEMSVGASVDPYLRFDANLVFAPFGVEVEEAYATTLALPANLQARAGQFLTSFGRLNTTHPHTWSFLDQPIANGKFLGGEGSRGLGVELSWLSPLPWYVELTGSTTMATGECCARSFYGGNDLGVDGPQDLLYTTRIEQFFPFGDELSLLWGLSGQFGPNPTGLGNRTEIYGSDLYLRYKPLNSPNRSSYSLQIEGMFRSRQVPGDVLQDYGGYAMFVANFTPRWEAGIRHELVTGVDDDPLDPEWTGVRHRTSIQGTFYPSHFSRLRLQLGYDAPSWFEEPVYSGMLGLEVLVGAHGSHEF